MMQEINDFRWFVIESSKPGYWQEFHAWKERGAVPVLNPERMKEIENKVAPIENWREISIRQIRSVA